jgi:SET domain-containing protein
MARATNGRVSTSGLPRAEHVYAAPSRRHGLGVFAAHRIMQGTIIERCPVLVVAAQHVASLERSGMYGYLYEWDGDAGVALGFGCLYNHSFEPNAEYEAWIDDKLVVVRALRTIGAGEEITLNYAGPDDPAHLWFDSVE